MTSPPSGPGTAPRISRRLRSGSARTTSRFKIVTRSLPIWPAIRMPLNTREGVAHAPMEPGERCLRCVPWLLDMPEKPWRFITPANPLPLETPTTSARSPAANTSALISWPGSYEDASSVRSSTT